MRWTYTIALVMLFVGCGHGAQTVKWRAPLVQDEYPLDEDGRRLSSGESAYCPVVQVQDYAGSYVPYSRPLKVNPFFRERLVAFEEVVARVATQTLGAPPVAILHFGTYNCRTIAGRRKLSEHAYANAIDVSGFEFATPSGNVKISIKKDWWRDTPYAGFMHQLVLELAARPDIFRGVLGPGYPGHDDHLHLDVGPRYYINVDVPG